MIHSSDVNNETLGTQLVEVKLFSGSASYYLSDKLGSVALNRFSDGEMQPIINESVRGAYVFFIQSTFSPADNLLELLLLIDAAKRASAGYISAIIPYFGYARQDRKDKSRVPISAKLIANLLQAAGTNRVMTMDLHADQLQGFFDIPVDHLKSEAIFIPFLSEQDMSNVTFASPDVGGVKKARTFAKHFKRNLVICDKYRERANEVAGMTVIGDVQGADVILVDDLVDTAGTLCRAASILLEKGAKSVRALCTHPVLSGNAYENIENSVLDELIVCDTIPLKRPSKKIKVLSTAKLFARAIRNTHEHRSISALFIEE
jgi:ribose-phosphate pyrophosphokinase